jgi:3-methyladenine DNA glycosylase Tag
VPKIQDFSRILHAAEERKGGAKNLAKLLPDAPPSGAQLKRLKDNFVLSTLSKGVFRAGFSWTVVEQRWPAIEAALHGFEPEQVANYVAKDIERYLQAAGVIKNRVRLQATIENAAWLLEIRGEYGSFGAMLAKWPSATIIALWQKMKDEGARLGGSTGPYLLRELGKDSWLPSPSVMKALVFHCILDSPATGKRNLQAAQEAFNAWHQQNGRSYTELSKIAAMSVDD